MKTVSQLSLVVLLIALLVSNLNCVKDWDCGDDKIDEIYFEDETRAFCPIDTSKSLVFRNSIGQEMRFICKNPTAIRLPLAEKRCGTGVQPQYTYNNGDYVELPFYQDSNYVEYLELRFILKTGGTPITATNEKADYFDWFTARLGYDASKTNGTTKIEYLVSDRGNDPSVLESTMNMVCFRTIKDTVILGNQYNDLVASLPSFGMQEDDQYALFYKPNMGPVAFSTKNGEVYVFDRFE